MNACEKEVLNAICSLVILSRVITMFEWTGCVLLARNGFDVSPLKKLGQRRGDIEFAALCQMCQVSNRAPAIQQQEQPAFSAWESAGQGDGRRAGDHTEDRSCSKGALLCAKCGHHVSPPYYEMTE